ncbi:hypothetical protein HZS38_11100 [Xenorhabdus nematophila]|uniref:Calcium-dependent cell adhesion molecule 1 membrane-binding domain-containing protein n=1 Tax=Xenorhabdus nematophila (strain ATCC 19061 / DSM 3370 / CCUG 14189 / LMG 1036 / NCIMB 9965 / AN6) TaxID=406817 RepID=D3V8R1_XENNA|nr:hypothetical protein [Xenorhabdus nematophila]CEE93621.1 hypothetical protein XNA1_4090002 [Xenorhabdus nematophila str. Anatoliense]CEF30873.1 hypothetical protein XNW1_2860005 [Xenorhabdus nematophila str. Websteri]AYA40918.1 hypothetical protein D3790_11050 [Xenorhabdus nematophila]KHD28551.1 hypothetical protein LH67_09055 [Xenorhabdus nematophila]MBA0019667.1 hypothetical protein [Xenorhabdus nematophila]
MTLTSDVAYYQPANFSIDLNLIDTTDAKAGTYLMILDAEGIRDAQIPSVKVDSKMEYVNIPSTASSNDITCAFYIRNRDNRNYPLIGTLYLSYQPLSGFVDITSMKVSPESQLDLHIDRVDGTKFEFTLKTK